MIESRIKFEKEFKTICGKLTNRSYKVWIWADFRGCNFEFILAELMLRLTKNILGTHGHDKSFSLYNDLQYLLNSINAESLIRWCNLRKMKLKNWKLPTLGKLEMIHHSLLCAVIYRPSSLLWNAKGDSISKIVERNKRYCQKLNVKIQRVSLIQ